MNEIKELIVFLIKIIIATIYVYLLYKLNHYCLDLLNEECLELKTKLDNIRALNLQAEHLQKNYSYINSYKTNYSFNLNTINNNLTLKSEATNYRGYNYRNLNG